MYRITNEQLIEKCKEARLICLEPEYKGYYHEYKVQCSKGHITYKKYETIREGCGCSHPDCLHEYHRLTLEEVKQRSKELYNYE